MRERERDREREKEKDRQTEKRCSICITFTYANFFYVSGWAENLIGWKVFMMITFMINEI